MAGDWIKFEHATPDKPEVYQMAELLDIEPEHVVGCLLRIWIWADQQIVSCNAMSVTKKVVDRFTRVTGFADAMEAVGWLVVTDGGIEFPKFDRHNGETAKNRAQTYRRVAKHRGKGQTTVTQSALQNGRSSVTKALPETETETETERGNPPNPPRRKKCSSKTEQEPIGFAEWYATYPRQQARDTACKAYVNAIRKVDVSHLQERTTAYAAAVARWPEEDNPKFVPMPATWLNQGRWDDDPKTWERKPPQGSRNDRPVSKCHNTYQF